MKYNEKSVKRHVDCLEAFGLISCSLLIGSLIMIKVLLGDDFYGLSGFLLFSGTLLLVSLISIPLVLMIRWLVGIMFDFLPDSDIYDLGYNDGYRDQAKDKKATSHVAELKNEK